MKNVIDNFSEASSNYSLFRPESPDSIFNWLYGYVNEFDCAWDCGTGNGRAAVRLAERFKHVLATDISDEQLNAAPKRDNIVYRAERAEQTSLPDNSVNLITIAQAIHWFDFDSFYDEVRRVAKPGAIIAAWTYNHLRINPEINAAIDHLFQVTRPYWDKERKYVDEEYRTIPFPFEELKVPDFYIVKRLNLQQLKGFLGTWSGLKRYVKETHEDPIAAITPELEKAWGDGDTHEATWPVFARVGRVK